MSIRPRAALDEAQHPRVVFTDRHAVDQANGPSGRLERRLEDKGVISISPRARAPRADPAGAMRQNPFPSSPRIRAKQAPESKRGRHSQSIEPSRPTRAAVWVSPMSP